jgi:hypothetical protein
VENRYLAVASPEIPTTVRYLLYRLQEVWPTMQAYGEDQDSYTYKCRCVPAALRIYCSEQDVVGEILNPTGFQIFDIEVGPQHIRFSYQNPDCLPAIQHLTGDPIWGPDYVDRVSTEQPQKAKTAVVPQLPTQAEAK